MPPIGGGDGQSSRPVESHDGIAVVGFDLRFPQDGDTPTGFWKMLRNKRTAMTEFPPDRLNIDAFHSYTSNQSASLPMRGAHFLKGDIGAFDADFFSIYPSEACAMDPQQRIYLETTYRALENAGIKMEDICGSNTAVITGTFTNDYCTQALKDPMHMPSHMAVGATLSMLANRLSWFFDLKGPSFNVDAACASSAIAIQTACDQLRRGDCDMAVVGGSNIILDPDFSMALGNMHFLSKDSQCFSFDSRSNGYARGEGVGVVILKRAADALLQNDKIRAVIRAARSNQGGRTPNITQPSYDAQLQLIKDTYRIAGLSMEPTRFFEAHGTGTTIGDPIEAHAIINAFQSTRSAQDPLFIGAVKTNVGHLEGAAGIAALLKSVMVLETGIIPPNANFDQMNPRIYDPTACLVFPTSEFKWPETSIRRISMSVFGYGGSNCHIILDDAHSYVRDKAPLYYKQSFSDLVAVLGKYPREEVNSTSTLHRPRLLIWSAHDERALDVQQRSWTQYVEDILPENQDNELLRDISYTLCERRSRLPWSSFSVVRGAADFAVLSSLSSQPKQRSKHAPRLAFVFTGQGAQWYAMGRELLKYPAFEAVVDKATQLFRSMGCSWLAKEELLKTQEVSRVDLPDLAQPLTATIQIALVDLLGEVGVRPVAVVGHSMGEIAAAYCAGALSQQSALELAYWRGQLVASVPLRDAVKGGMLAVGLSAAEAVAYFELVKCPSVKYPLTVSCHNSPCNVTISGEEDQLNELRLLLESDKVFVRKLRVSAAYHSPQLKQIADDCLLHFGTISFEPRCMNAQMVSTVDGLLVSFDQLACSQHWVNNMICPVLFDAAIRRLCMDTANCLTHKIDASHRQAIVVDHIIEIGPHAALKLPTQQILKPLSRGSQVNYSSVLWRSKPADQTFLELLGDLYCVGYPVKLDQVRSVGPAEVIQPRLLVDGPGYAFDHSRRYWNESEIVKKYRFRSHGFTELLGYPVPDWRPFLPEWRQRLSLADMPWIEDHAINGMVLYPAAAIIGAAVQGVLKLVDRPASISAFVLRSIEFLAPIVFVQTSDQIEVRSVLQPMDESRDASQSWKFSFYSNTHGQWTRNCTCLVRLERHQNAKAYQEPLSLLSLGFWPSLQVCTQKVTKADLYGSWTREGFQYGASFQKIVHAHHDGNDKALAILDCRSEISETEQPLIEGISMTPGTLDSVLQVMLVALSHGGQRSITSYIVQSIDKLLIPVRPRESLSTQMEASSQICSTTAQECHGSILGIDSFDGQVLIKVDGLKTVKTRSQSANRDSDSQLASPIYSIHTFPDVTLMDSTQISEQLYKACSKVASPAGAAKPFPRNLNHQFGLSNIEKLPNQDQVVSSDACQECDLTRQLKLCNNTINSLAPSRLPRKFHFEMAAEYLSWLLSKSPDLRILQTGTGCHASEPCILDALEWASAAGIQPYTSATYVALEFDDPRCSDDQAWMTTHENCSHITVSKGWLGLENSDVKDKRFDVVIATQTSKLSDGMISALLRIKKYLKPSGKLILSDEDLTGIAPRTTPSSSAHLDDQVHKTVDRGDHSKSSLAWHEALLSTGFSLISWTSPFFGDKDSDSSRIIVAEAIQEPSRSLVNRKVVLLTDQMSIAQRHLADILKARLTFIGFDTVEVCNIADDSPITSDDTFLVSLLEVDAPFLASLNDSTFQKLKRILQNSNSLLWVSGRPSPMLAAGFGMARGLCKVLAIEDPLKKVSVLEIELAKSEQQEISNGVLKLIAKFRESPLEIEEAYTMESGCLQISRIFESSEVSAALQPQAIGTALVEKSLREVRPFVVEMRPQGQSAALLALRDTESALKDHGQLVEIELSAVQLRSTEDPILHTGAGPDQMQRAVAGVVKRQNIGTNFNLGDQVCTFTPGSALKSNIHCLSSSLLRVPNGLEAADAVSILEESHFAYYIISEACRVRNGDTVLIRGSESLLMLTLITITLQLCESVCVSVPISDDPSRIKAIYDTTSVHVMHDSDLLTGSCYLQSKSPNRFIDLSKAKGADDLQHFIAPFGTYARVSEKPLNESIHPSLPKNVFFASIDRDAVFRQPLVMAQATLQMLLNSVASSAFSHIRIPTIPISKVPDFIHTPKSNMDGSESRTAVLTFDDNDRLSLTEPVEVLTKLKPERSYVIAGGLGALGQQVARWMVSRGARHLVLLSRKGVSSQDAQITVDELRQQGAKVLTPQCDIADSASLLRVIREASAQVPPIKGCVQASAALRDVQYSQMEVHDWNCAVQPKVHGSWNLHTILPDDMDFFVFASSITGIVGQATQINYAAGNTFQDSLARYRTSLGAKSISLDLGILSTGGLVDISPGLIDRLNKGGQYEIISIEQVFALLDHYCNEQLKLTDPEQAQVVVGIKRPLDILTAGKELPSAMQSPLWSLARPPARKILEAVSTSQEGVTALHDQLAKASSRAEKESVVAQSLGRRICHLLSIPATQITMDRPIYTYGADSLMAIELRNWIFSTFQVDMPTFDILGETSIADCAKSIVRLTAVKEGSS